jgi:hypothetical protein
MEFAPRNAAGNSPANGSTPVTASKELQSNYQTEAKEPSSS